MVETEVTCAALIISLSSELLYNGKFHPFSTKLLPFFAKAGTPLFPRAKNGTVAKQLYHSSIDSRYRGSLVSRLPESVVAYPDHDIDADALENTPTRPSLGLDGVSQSCCPISGTIQTSVPRCFSITMFLS